MFRHPFRYFMSWLMAKVYVTRIRDKLALDLRIKSHMMVERDNYNQRLDTLEKNINRQLRDLDRDNW